MHLFSLRCAALLAASLAVFAPTPQAAAASAELKIAVAADVTSIDPHFFNLFPNNNVAEHIFDKLVQMDPDSKMIPGLATSWKTIDDRTWEFKLRKGVKFTDGTELTAEDVVFSIDRVPTVPNSPGPFSAYTKAIVGKEIVDPYTIRFKYAAPYPLAPNDLLGAVNWGRYSNVKVDYLIEQALQQVNDENRSAMLQNATKLAMEDLGIMPIHFQFTIWATTKNVAYTPRTDEYTLAFQFRPAGTRL